MNKVVIYTLAFCVFFICTSSQAFARQELMNIYLPAFIGNNQVSQDADEDDDNGLTSTGDFQKDYKLAIAGIEPSRFSLKTVADRYNEMGYTARVCIQVSYYHLNGGPFDKIIVNGTIYDILVIEQPPVRWNFGPFRVDNRGQCI